MTAEEYVVQRVQELEGGNKWLEAELDGTRKCFEETKEVLEKVCKGATVHETSNGLKYISFQNLWTDVDAETFDFLVGELYVTGKEVKE